MREVYKGLWWRLGRTLYPSHCLLCDAPGARGLDLCAPCAAELPRNAPCCARCAAPLAHAAPVCGRCLRWVPPWERAWAPFRYQPPLDYLLQRFKFDGRLEHGALLGELMALALPSTPAGAAPRLLVPVPLHPQRLRQRGFNQAVVLGRELARRATLPLRPDVLARVRRTPPQVALDARARRVNLRGAFALAQPVRGQRVVLLDDVITTGATLGEAARVLLRGGAASVEVWALAVAPAPRR